MPGRWESHEVCLCEEGSGVGTGETGLAFQQAELQLVPGGAPA